MGPRLLIAVGEVASSTADVPPTVRAVVDAAEEVFVVAPALPGRLDWLNSDSDAAHPRADERLRTVLGQLGDMGAQARGTVGSDEPVEALADANSSVRARPPVDRVAWIARFRLAGAWARRTRRRAVRIARDGVPTMSS